MEKGIEKVVKEFLKNETIIEFYSNLPLTENKKYEQMLNHVIKSLNYKFRKKRKLQNSDSKCKKVNYFLFPRFLINRTNSTLNLLTNDKRYESMFEYNISDVIGENFYLEIKKAKKNISLYTNYLKKQYYVYISKEITPHNDEYLHKLLTETIIKNIFFDNSCYCFEVTFSFYENLINHNQKHNKTLINIIKKFKKHRKENSHYETLCIDFNERNFIIENKIEEKLYLLHLGCIEDKIRICVYIEPLIVFYNFLYENRFENTEIYKEKLQKYCDKFYDEYYKILADLEIINNKIGKRYVIIEIEPNENDIEIKLFCVFLKHYIHDESIFDEILIEFMDQRRKWKNKMLNRKF